MSLATRQWIARFAAPAAFLLAVTVAILLIRAGLNGSEAADTTATVTTASTTESTTTTTRTTTRRRPPARYYRIESGDTYATIAERFDTTVEQLLALNPDVDPNALRVGQRIRVA